MLLNFGSNKIVISRKKIQIKLKSKRLLQRLVKQRKNKAKVYSISIGQHQSSSGLLGKKRKLHGMTC